MVKTHVHILFLNVCFCLSQVHRLCGQCLTERPYCVPSRLSVFNLFPEPCWSIPILFPLPKYVGRTVLVAKALYGQTSRENSPKQVESTQKDGRTMRWHPLMIRWCLSLRHHSSSAYEILQESGCLTLPTQRTLRDYTYYTKATTEFSTEVDKILKETVKVSNCSTRGKYVLLMLDEMHTREDLVYDKHSGGPTWGKSTMPYWPINVH